MVHIIVTTVIRNGSQEQNGYIYDIDWTHKRIRHQFPLPHVEVNELGPRGGARGARGVVSANGYFYIANFNTVFVYDDNWQLHGEIQHPLFNGLHEIDCDADGLWISSTGLDALLKIDWAGNLKESFFLGELEPDLRDWLQIIERPCDRDRDHRFNFYPNESLVTHLNCVRIHEDRPYVCLSKQGTIIALDPLEVVVPPTGQAGYHNGTRIDSDLLLVNSSFEKKLTGFNPQDGQQNFEIDWQTELKTVNQNDKQLLERVFSGDQTHDAPAHLGWARGLAVLESGHVLIGFAPAMIAELSLEEKKVIDVFPLDDDVCHAVHGLCVVP